MEPPPDPQSRSPRALGLRGKLLLSLGAAVLVVAGLALVTLSRTQARALERERARVVAVLAGTVAQSVARQLQAQADAQVDLQRLTEVYADLEGIDIVEVYDPKGRLIAFRRQAPQGEAVAIVHTELARQVARTADSVEHVDEQHRRLSRFTPVVEPGTDPPVVVAVIEVGAPEPSGGEPRTRSVVEELVGEAVLSGVSARHKSERHIQRMCEELATLDELLWVEVFDRFAEVVAHSRRERVGRPPLPDHQAAVQQVLAIGRPATVAPTVRGEQSHFVPVTRDGEVGGEVLGVVELVADDATVAAKVAASQRQLVAVVGAIALFTGLVVFGLLRRLILLPVARIAAATGRVASGELSHRVEVRSSDELGELAAAFNTMVANLRETTVSRDELERIFDSMHDALLVTVDGRIRSCNEAARDLFDVGPGELLGQVVADRVVAEESEGGGPREGWFVRASGERVPVLFSETPTTTADGEVATVVLAHDRRHEHRLRAVRRRAQALEHIGNLAGGVAHEFNNLLTVVIGYGSLLVGRFDEADPRRGEVAALLAAARRAAALTEALLALGRRQVLQTRAVDPVQLLEATQRDAEELAPPGVTVTLTAQVDRVRLLADEARLRRMLLNLVQNALDALAGEGELTLGATTVQLDAERIAAEGLALEPGNYVALTVADDGCGMDPDLLARCCEPFFTTHEVGQATGLGLAEAFGFTRQSRGDLTIASRPGVGTTVTLYLPRDSGVVALAHADGLVSGLYRELLRADGLTALTAPDAAGALELLEERPGPIHALVIDVELLGEGGAAAFAERARGLRPETELLFLSQGPLDVGGHAVLTTPTLPEAFVRAVRQRVRGGQGRGAPTTA